MPARTRAGKIPDTAARPGGRGTAGAAGAFAARCAGGVGIQLLAGAWDDEAARRLDAALAGGAAGKVRALRRDAHAPEAGCRLHGDGGCLSCREPGLERAAANVQRGGTPTAS